MRPRRPAVLARLVANASRTPPGPVEDDVSADVVSFAKNMAKNFPDAQVGTGPAAIRAGIAEEFNTFRIEGPMTSLFTNESAAVFAGKVKGSAEAVKTWEEQKFQSSGNQGGLVFAPGSSQYLSPSVPADGEVIATVGFVKEKGAWKVYCIYFSAGPMEADNRDFLIRKLSAPDRGN